MSRCQRASASKITSVSVHSCIASACAQGQALRRARSVTDNGQHSAHDLRRAQSFRPTRMAPPAAGLLAKMCLPRLSAVMAPAATRPAK